MCEDVFYASDFEEDGLVLLLGVGVVVLRLWEQKILVVWVLFVLCAEAREVVAVRGREKEFAYPLTVPADKFALQAPDFSECAVQVDLAGDGHIGVHGRTCEQTVHRRDDCGSCRRSVFRHCGVGAVDVQSVARVMVVVVIVQSVSPERLAGARSSLARMIARMRGWGWRGWRRGCWWRGWRRGWW